MKYLAIVTTLLFIIYFDSCGIYGHKSESRAYSIKIDLIENPKNLISSELNYKLAEKLKDKMRNQEDFYLVEDKEADFIITGKITDYQTKPFAIDANEIVRINRASLSINISLQSNIDGVKITNKNCKMYVDFGASQNYFAIQDSLNQVLSTKMVDEIYYQLFMEW